MKARGVMLGRLAGHALLAPLGDGGMGKVWLARAERPDAPLVALKTLRDDVVADPRVRAMFFKEMRLAAAIRHPNVAAVLASGEDAGAPYLVMEWVDGCSLRRLSRAGRRIPLGIALRITRDVCSALHVAHELRDERGAPVGLVHRDVSPHNIVVARSGQAKLIDFGVAKVRELAPGDASSSGGVKGKVRYMAPEQALARGVDRRADVFALGVVLFELVTGRPPFEAPNDVAVLCELLSKAPVTIPEDVPAPVAEILRAALAKRVKERYPTALAMQEALAAAIAGLGVAVTEADVAAFVRETEPDDALRRAVAAVVDPPDAPTVVTAARSRPSRPARRERVAGLWLLGGFAVAALTTGSVLLGRAVGAPDEVAPAAVVTADLAAADLHGAGLARFPVVAPDFAGAPRSPAPANEASGWQAPGEAAGANGAALEPAPAAEVADVTPAPAAEVADVTPAPAAEAADATEVAPAPARASAARVPSLGRATARGARAPRGEAPVGSASRASRDDLASSLRDRR
ncbi:MAG: serine/threonine protein kinase [Labilithrix sp.]|nr:serine/threonine protein kinase [Labilithrix sp.]